MRRLLLLAERGRARRATACAQVSVYDPANTARNTISASLEQYLLETSGCSTRSSGHGRVD